MRGRKLAIEGQSLQLMIEKMGSRSLGQSPAAKLCIFWLLSWQLQGVFRLNGVEGQNLQVGFYQLTCPTAEVIVSNVVSQAFLLDNTITASLIRVFFHDCFVQGCDASILLTGNNTEQNAIPNTSLRGYYVITAAKAQLEAACPGIVSCADIIALAARDSVGLLGGPTYPTLTGRLDGLAPGFPIILPSPTDGVVASVPIFASVGLTTEDMVTLLGAHTVGTAQCQFFVNRLYNFQNTGLPDPTLNVTYLATLQTLCPLNGTGITLVAMDVGSEFQFDTSYYNNIQQKRGVLVIDQEIVSNITTSPFVQNFTGPSLNASNAFSTSFVAAMTKMGNIGLKTYLNGQIRTVCEVPNV